jgi:5S rRNA maturation endonuclease (ribonuclease M5)
MFNFTIEPKITKEFLLSKNSEETYMSYYLGVPIKKGLFRSPLRNDQHSTCSFFRGQSGNLYFKDFATGQCLTFEGVVMAKYGCTYHNALKIIAIDFGYIQSDEVKKQAAKKPQIKIQPKFESEKETFIQVEIKDFSESELKWWNSFGISKETLNKYKVYSIKTVFLNGSIYAQSTQHSPIYGYYFGKKGDIEQWRIYIPKRKEFRFIGNVSTKTIQGYKQLPEKGKLLVITKSMKDSMLLSSLGIPAVAPNSETQFVSEKLLEELKERFKNIVLLYDSDLTGVRFMNKIRKQYRDLIVCMIPRKYEAKDISDFYQKYGRSKTIEVIKEYINYIKREKEIA